MEVEGRPRHPLMLKEWLELEYSAELSRDGFGCYPRHLATEPRTRTRSAGCRRRRNSNVIARVSAAVRAALSRPPSASARQGEAAVVALRRSLSTRLRVVGFWKTKRRGEVEEMDRHRSVASCSATAAISGMRDGASSPASTSPRRRMGRESRQAGGDRAGLSSDRRGHETVAEGCECEATCHLDEEREQEQRLSPVSVMDFQSQDGDDDCNDSGGGCDCHSEDEGTSPTFERSLANVRRASQQLLDRIRRFEQLAELDTSAVDDAATTADDDTSCYVGELDSAEDDEDAERGPVQRHLPGLPEATSSPCAARCFEQLLEDFFREGLSSCHAGGSADSDLEMSLLETAKAWLDGGHYCAALRSDQKAEVEEIERVGRWRRFREDEHEELGSDVEGGIFCSLMEELVEELC